MRRNAACLWLVPALAMALAACSSGKTPEVVDPNFVPHQLQTGNSEYADALARRSDQCARRFYFRSRAHPDRHKSTLYGLRPLQCARRQPPLHRQQGPHRLFLRRPSQPIGRGHHGAMRQRRLQAVPRTGKALSGHEVQLENNASLSAVRQRAQPVKSSSHCSRTSPAMTVAHRYRGAPRSTTSSGPSAAA